MAFTGMRLKVMTHALCAEEGSLLQGVMIQNTYTKMHNGKQCTSDSEEEDPSGKSGSCQLGA